MRIVRLIIHRLTTAIQQTTTFIGGVVLCALPIIMSSSTPFTALEKIKKNGFLEMYTLNGPSTYYEGPFEHAGFEFELAEAFANDLGVELTVTVENSVDALFESINHMDSHFAAAGLAIQESKEQKISFSKPYSTATPLVVFQRDTPRPKTIEDLIGRDIIVIKDSVHAAALENIKKEFPLLEWREESDAEMADLLAKVHNGNAEITIVDATVHTVNSVVYPKARSAFTLDKSHQVAWAFPKNNDESLLNAANAFIEKSINNETITQLTEKYFSKPTVDEGNALAFSRRIEERLPQWVDLFKESAEKHDLDWLFLAAISYQESLWNKNAKSFTGVRGLMMLTSATAKELGVTDRTDPQQSISGGAEYFIRMKKRIPSDIEEPNTTWMALAAYNVGLGHLEDARVLTEKQGGDPDSWEDVKQRLPLLAKYAYYKDTRHGYARGWEPVQYVERIQNYHNILAWHFNKQPETKDNVIPEKLEATVGINTSK